MRKSTKRVAEAFIAGTRATEEHVSTDGACVWSYGLPIAKSFGKGKARYVRLIEYDRCRKPDGSRSATTCSHWLDLRFLVGEAGMRIEYVQSVC